MSKLRSRRVGEAMKSTLAELLAYEVKDPRIGFTSVVRVDVANDLSQAKVYVSVLGDDEAQASTLKGLTSASGHLRREVARRLQLRHTPELLFHLDKGMEHGARIAQLLKEVQRGEGEEER